MKWGLLVATMCLLSVVRGAELKVQEDIRGDVSPNRKGELAISGNLLHWAYVSVRGNKEQVVVDGKPEDTYDEIITPQLPGSSAPVLFSEYGSSHAYIGQWFDRTNLYGLIANGERGPGCQQFVSFAISPDGRKSAHSATLYALKREDRKHVIVMNGKVVFESQSGSSTPWMVAFSPCSRYLAWAAREGTGDFGIYVNGKRRFNVDGYVTSIQLSYGAEYVYAVHSSEDGDKLTVNGKSGQPYSAIIGLVLSADGSGYAYIGQQGNAKTVVHNGKEMKYAPEIGSLVISPDGRHVAYLAITPGSDNPQVACLDGKEVGPGFAGSNYAKVAISPDGRHVVCLADAAGGAKAVVVDGKQRFLFESGWTYGQTSFYWRPNSQDIVAVTDQNCVLFNDQLVGKYDSLPDFFDTYKLRWLTPDVFAFPTIKNGKYVVVKVAIDGAEIPGIDDTVPDTIAAPEAPPPDAGIPAELKKQVEERLQASLAGLELDQEAVAKANNLPWPLQAPSATATELDKQVTAHMEKALNERYGPQVLTRIRAEGDRRYKPFQIGESITLRLTTREGQVTGRLYETNSSYVKIGDRRISVKDLHPDDAARLGKGSEYQRDRFIREQTARLEKVRATFREQGLLKLRAHYYGKAGYVRVGEKWLTAADAMAPLLERERERQARTIKRKLEDEIYGGAGFARDGDTWRKQD